MPKKSLKKIRDPKRDPTHRLLVAVGHPLRRRILQSLMREPASATTLAAQFDMKDKLGLVSYHLCKALFQECEVVEVVAIHPRRGAYEKVFALKPEAFLGVIEWPKLPRFVAASLRGVALASFLEAAVAAIEAEADCVRPDDSRGRGFYEFWPIGVDADGHREISEAAEKLAETVNSVADRCSGSEPTELTQLVVGTAVFEAVPLSSQEAA